MTLALSQAAPTQSCATRSVGLLDREAGAAPGYRLFTPLDHPTTWLLDEHGRVAHQWPATERTRQAELGHDGLLLRTIVVDNPPLHGHSGATGRVELVDWQGAVVWQFQLADSESSLHHDALRLADGDLLLSCWDRIDAAAMIQAGRDPQLVPPAGYLLAERLIRIRPDPVSGQGGAVIWEWRAWDHLIQDFDPARAGHGDVAATPGRIDINYGRDYREPDWLRITALDHAPQHDEILLTVHGFDEVWILDLNTTTAEAAGAAGDLRYRWGNPEAYRRGGANERVFEGIHDAQWVAAGHPGAGDVLVWNNGLRRGFGSIDEWTPPRIANGYADPGGAAYTPARLTRSHRGTTTDRMFSPDLGAVQRLPNGNTAALVGGEGRALEVDAADARAWQYVNPILASGALVQGQRVPGRTGARDNAIAHLRYYAAAHPGLANRSLDATEVLELGYGIEILHEAGSARGGRVEHGMCSSYDDVILPLRLTGARADTLGGLIASLHPDTTPIAPTLAGLLNRDTWLVEVFRSDSNGAWFWPIFGSLPVGTDLWMQFGTFAVEGRAITLEVSPMLRVWRR